MPRSVKKKARPMTRHRTRPQERKFLIPKIRLERLALQCRGCGTETWKPISHLNEDELRAPFTIIECCQHCP